MGLRDDLPGGAKGRGQLVEVLGFREVWGVHPQAPLLQVSGPLNPRVCGAWLLRVPQARPEAFGVCVSPAPQTDGRAPGLPSCLDYYYALHGRGLAAAAGHRHRHRHRRPAGPGRLQRPAGCVHRHQRAARGRPGGSDADLNGRGQHHLPFALVRAAVGPARRARGR